MQKRQDLSDELLRHATEHGNVVSLSELREDGIGPAALHRMRGAVLQPLGAGWFSLGEPTWRGQLHAGLAIGGKQAIAYRRTALTLHGFMPEEPPVELLVPTKVRSRDWVRFVRASTDFRPVIPSLHPPRTSFESAVIDVVDSLDEAAAIAMLTRAIQERRTTAGRLLAALAGRVRLRHRDLVTDLLRDADGIESVLEHAYAVRVEKRHRLPPAQRQYVVPQTRHRCDLAYPELRRLFELDGAEFHDPVADRRLDNEHAALGFHTTRLDWTDAVVTPCATADLVARSIEIDPDQHRCPDCRNGA